MKLNKKELNVLKVCCEEPGTFKQISKESKLERKKVEEILRKLERLKLIYKNDNFFSSTIEGDKYLYKNRKGN